jgi:hypothetical protein
MLEQRKFLFPRAMLLLLPLFCFAPVKPLWGQVPSTAVRMQKVIRQFVQDTDNELVGVGSWITGGSYRDILDTKNLITASDHDLRLILTKACEPEQAVTKWKEVRRQLILYIDKEFKSEASFVRAKTNLYAPNQAMVGVEDAEDARAFFIRHNEVPNLGYHRQVDAKAAKESAEGLYGRGAKAWTQSYEKSAGRRFYKLQGQVFTSGTQYLHEKELIALSTPKGATNTARQWIEHTLEALGKEDGRAVGKHLERLERDITKAKNLLGLSVDEAFRMEAKTLAAQLKSNPASLSYVRDRVTQLLQRSSVETAILARFEDSSKTQQAIFRALLRAIQSGDETGKKILELAKKVPVATILDALARLFSAYELGTAYQQADYLKALAAMQIQLDPFAIGILAEITYQCIESAKDAGATLVANRQDCSDLMQGIYAGGNFEAEGTTVTQDELFHRFKDENELKKFVMERATEASRRNLGEKNDVYDARIAEAKFAKCFPSISAVWKARRERLAAEYHRLFQELVDSPISLMYAPTPLSIDPVTKKATATVIIVESKEDGDRMVRMKKIAQQLTTQIPTLHCYYVWSPGGKETGHTQKRIFEYTEPGFFTVEVKRVWTSKGHGKNPPDGLNGKGESLQGIDVEVKGREADGDYEGFLAFDSIRLINQEGVTTTIDPKNVEANRVKVKLNLRDEKASLSLVTPGLQGEEATVKMSGKLSPNTNNFSINKIESYKLDSALIRKIEISFDGKLSEADLVKGTWKIYIAAESVGDNPQENETGFFHASGTWTVKKLAVQKTQKSAGAQQKFPEKTKK